MAQIRARGYALDLQEHEEGVCCVAAPVFGFDGQVAGSVSVTAPAFRRDEAAIQELAPVVLEAAQEISAELGGGRSGTRKEPARSGAAQARET